MARVTLTFGDLRLVVRTLDTPTARALLDCMPFASVARTWGDEVYFDTPAHAAAEPDARVVLEPGEIAFWLAGDCIAIGFGPTPASHGDEIRLASPGNVWALAEGDVAALRAVAGGTPVQVEVSP
ncbi:MAG: hypothetical protein H6907_03480 [Hyphomicrobiales bacterium]|nr:hypothetical protein [Hyphomicrobiales bacterium]MCP5370770.1 hypothetical protein [Hyphomicrobiales bacterium]